jgi:hypothetical protein
VVLASAGDEARDARDLVWPKGFRDEPTLPESVPDQGYKVQAAACLRGCHWTGSGRRDGGERLQAVLVRRRQAARTRCHKSPLARASAAGRRPEILGRTARMRPGLPGAGVDHVLARR